MQNNNCKNQSQLTDQRIKELHGIANEMRKHRIDWNSNLIEPSNLIPELNSEAKELEQIFETLQNFNYVSDSFYTTFNDVFATYFSGNPENADSALQVFNKLSALLRKISLKSDLIERQGEYYSNLSNEATQLEISNMEAKNIMKSA